MNSPSKSDTYCCLPRRRLSDGKSYSIESLRQCDSDSIRCWRNEQIPILRQQAPITKEQQDTYFRTIIAPSFEEAQPRQLLMSFLLNGECIGYGGIVHIDWIARRGEVSFLLATDRNSDKALFAADFSHFLPLLLALAFRDLAFHRLHTEAYAFRTQIISLLEHAGFRHEGILRDHAFKEGRWWDSIVQGLLEEEYRVRYSNDPVF